MDKLGVFNKCLVEFLGERAISSLSESVKSRRVLYSIWDGDLVNYALSAGMWDFASRAIKIDETPSVAPAFGWLYAFEIPSDFVSLVELSDNEDFSGSYTEYDIDAKYIYSDQSYLYLKYISDDGDYGGDLSLWTPAFTDYVACLMANRAASPMLLSKSDRDRLEIKLTKMALPFAKNKNAQNRPNRRIERGTWSNARYGGNGYGNNGYGKE